MSPDRRQILQQVADGELTPEEAERLLRGDDGPADASPRLSVGRIKISLGVGRVDVVGDPSVAQAEVSGPHRIEITGDTMVISGELDVDGTGVGVTFALSRRARVKLRDRSASTLSIRVNPNIPLEVDLDAGPVSIRGVTGPIKARVAAGPITIEDFVGPLDVAVNAGAIRAIGKLTEGDSRIRSDAGAVRVELDPESSVRIVAHAALGKVIVPGDAERRKGGFGSDRREATIGAGEAELRVETAMGSVHVSTA